MFWGKGPLNPPTSGFRSLSAVVRSPSRSRTRRRGSPLAKCAKSRGHVRDSDTLSVGRRIRTASWKQDRAANTHRQLRRTAAGARKLRVTRRAPGQRSRRCKCANRRTKMLALLPEKMDRGCRRGRLRRARRRTRASLSKRSTTSINLTKPCASSPFARRRRGGARTSGARRTGRSPSRGTRSPSWKRLRRRRAARGRRWRP